MSYLLAPRERALIVTSAGRRDNHGPILTSETFSGFEAAVPRRFVPKREPP